MRSCPVGRNLGGRCRFVASIDQDGGDTGLFPDKIVRNRFAAEVSGSLRRNWANVLNGSIDRPQLSARTKPPPSCTAENATYQGTEFRANAPSPSKPRV